MIRRLLLAAALVLLPFPARAGDPVEPPGSRKSRELVERFLSAFRAGDAAGMAFVREAPISRARDPFVLASRLLRMHAANPSGDALAAARALAARVKDRASDAALPALVEAAAPDALVPLEDRMEAALAEGRWADGAALAEESRDAIAEAPPGAAAVCILAVAAECRGRLGRTEAALAAWAGARKAAARIGWSREEAGALWQSGYLRYRRGDLRGARADFEEQLAVIEARVGPEERSESLRWLGSACAGLGEFDRAFELLARSEEAARACGDGFHAALATQQRGTLEARVGRPARALALLEESRAAFLALSNPSRLGAAVSLGAIGGIETDLGRHRRAAEALRAALREFEDLGNRGEAARTRTDLGRALLALGDGEGALAETERSLAEWEDLHDRLGAARALEALGSLHLAAGRADRALEFHTRSLEEWEAMGNRPAAARARTALGEDRAALGDAAGALACTERALAETEVLRDRPGSARALRLAAAAERALGRPAESLASALRAVDLHLGLGTGLGEEDTAGLRREIHAVAGTGLRAALDLAASDPAARERAVAGAFRLAESSRGLLLVEGVLHRDALLAAAVPPDLREAVAGSRAGAEAARGALATLAASGSADAAALTSAKADLDAAYGKYEQAIARVQRESLRVADVLYPRPVDLAGLRAALAPGEAVVLYHLGAERAVALVATRDGADLRDLGPAAPVVAAAEEWLDIVSVAESDDAERAADLYDAILRPLEGALAGTTRLLVCPDGVLTFLPFEALARREGGRTGRILERWEIDVLPSATIFAALPRDPGPHGDGVLAVGDPVYPGEEGSAAAPGGTEAEIRGIGRLRRLRGTGEEARAIAGFAAPGKGTLLLREKAAVGALREALARTPGRLAALHVACHGFADPERPWLSGLVLSRGEVLTLDDIGSLRVPADLVVLSACETGRGRLLEGDGAMGLARAFLFAGAGRVVVSDWAVSDEATRLLMSSFYRALLRDGLPAGAALRAAKLEALRSGGPRAHPAHWAAFVLWGSPR